MTENKKSSKTSDKQKVQKIEHFLIPEHIKLSENEKQALFDHYNITIKELPKILVSDAAIKHLEPVENDVIKIVRKSNTAGNSVFYRGVVNE